MDIVAVVGSGSGVGVALGTADVSDGSGGDSVEEIMVFVVVAVC